MPKILLPSTVVAPNAELLDGIDSSVFAQSAFKSIKVGATLVVANDNTGVVEFIAGSGVTITPDESGDKITIAVNTTTITDDANHRLITDAQIAIWDAKQNALGYSPVDKAGDTMTGDLNLNAALNVQSKIKMQWNDSSKSLDFIFQ